MGAPRGDRVSRSCQCDKENHGWREGPPRPFSVKVSICWPGLHSPTKSASNETKRILLLRADRESLTRSVGRFFPTIRTLSPQPFKPALLSEISAATRE